MRTDTANAIGRLEGIAAFMPIALRDITDSVIRVLHDLDREASRPIEPPRLPSELVPWFRVNVYRDSTADIDVKAYDKAKEIEAWINSKAILPPEVVTPGVNETNEDESPF